MIDDKVADEDLVRSGNQAAIGNLLERYKLPLYGYIYRLSWLKTTDFIEDILQQTFAVFWKNHQDGKFQPAGPGTVRAYLYQIARNMTMEMNRKEIHQPQTAELELWEKLRSELPTGVQPDPETLKYQREILNRCLAELSGRDRKLITLYSQGVTYQKIHQDPLFRQEKLPNLRRRVCDLKKILRDCCKRRQNQ